VSCISVLVLVKMIDEAAAAVLGPSDDAMTSPQRSQASEAHLRVEASVN